MMKPFWWKMSLLVIVCSFIGGLFADYVAFHIARHVMLHYLGVGGY